MGHVAEVLEIAALLLLRWKVALILLPLIGWSRIFSLPAPFCPSQVHTRMPRPLGQQGPFLPVGWHHGADREHPATGVLWGREGVRLLHCN